jgi:hypothetical protein
VAWPGGGCGCPDMVAFKKDHLEGTENNVSTGLVKPDSIYDRGEDTRDDAGKAVLQGLTIKLTLGVELVCVLEKSQVAAVVELMGR